MKEIYTWSYVNPTNVRLLDHQFVVDAILFFNARVLERAVIEHLKPGSHVLQVGHTHGMTAALTSLFLSVSTRLPSYPLTPCTHTQATSALMRPALWAQLGDTLWWTSPRSSVSTPRGS